MERERCEWVTDEPVYITYHDEEWGRPTYDDRELFEMLILEGQQAGLSWITILKRRENYRKAFDQFDAEKIAGYGEEEVEELLKNAGIIRNRNKVLSVITNAKAFLKIVKEYGSFHRYIWQFTGGGPIINHPESQEEVPAQTETSKEMSKDLKKRGFKFVGPTICYAYMQATGMVNDHTENCFLSNKNEEEMER